MDSAASLATRQPNQAGVCDIPATINELQLAVAQRKIEIVGELYQRLRHSGWQCAAQQLSGEP
jgi:hypothetical protein